MARFFHPGGEHQTPVKKHPTLGTAFEVPPMFGVEPLTGKPLYRQATPNSIPISIVGHGFFVCQPGGSVDLPTEASEDLVKRLAPQLLTEDEAIAMGVVKAQIVVSPALPTAAAPADGKPPAKAGK